ncbi:hypothetical protein [Bradyrhizobium sp. CIR3A]|uniref:hypothetical protein n=1 Tax=Bradyrhizobium sp. CIR3A TaxID=2663838 RepID=UPI0017CC21FB|nr:hypothetical protein [Bradyrhizobium sp. CIR3A]
MTDFDSSARTPASDQHHLYSLVEDVKKGRLSRRPFVHRLIAVGFTAPMATQILALGGVATAQSASFYKPTKRGGGGALRLLWWQGLTLVNPHFGVGEKDLDGSRCSMSL